MKAFSARGRKPISNLYGTCFLASNKEQERIIGQETMPVLIHYDRTIADRRRHLISTRPPSPSEIGYGKIDQQLAVTASGRGSAAPQPHRLFPAVAAVFYCPRCYMNPYKLGCPPAAKYSLFNVPAAAAAVMTSIPIKTPRPSWKELGITLRPRDKAVPRPPFFVHRRIETQTPRRAAGKALGNMEQERRKATLQPPPPKQQTEQNGRHIHFIRRRRRRQDVGEAAGTLPSALACGRGAGSRCRRRRSCARRKGFLILLLLRAAAASSVFRKTRRRFPYSQPQPLRTSLCCVSLRHSQDPDCDGPPIKHPERSVRPPMEQQ